MLTGLPAQWTFMSLDCNLVGEIFNAQLWPSATRIWCHPIPNNKCQACAPTPRAQQTHAKMTGLPAKLSNQNTGLRIEAEYDKHSFPISYHADWIACAVNLHVTGLQLGRWNLPCTAWTSSIFDHKNSINLHFTGLQLGRWNLQCTAWTSSIFDHQNSNDTNRGQPCARGRCGNDRIAVLSNKKHCDDIRLVLLCQR